MVDRNDKTKNHDFTSIGDMTEFLHPEDEDVEKKFKEFNGDLEESETPNDPLIVSLPDLPIELEEEGEEVSEMSTEPEEVFDSSSVDDISFDFNELPETELEQEVQAEELENFTEEVIPEYTPPETLEEIKTFAQNFSYSDTPVGINPPYSIIVRGIKFQEDADTIIALLREYKIATKENESEFIRAIGYGNLLIPQINEYLAILLTHKLRRLDCSLEMGLSDQIQPPKNGDINPRGLTNKSNAHQNRFEHFSKDDSPIILPEFMITSTNQVLGHKILNYIGIETAFKIIETDDLDRLYFIQNSLSQNLESLNEETKEVYDDFTSEFKKIYSDLITEIKNSALLKNANALIGVTYGLTPYMNQSTVSKYQITCTATMAVITKEEQHAEKI